MDIEKMTKRYKEERSIICPHCQMDYAHDCEFREDLITYHGEDGAVEKQCGFCEEIFFVNEVVNRTFEITKTLDSC